MPATGLRTKYLVACALVTVLCSAPEVKAEQAVGSPPEAASPERRWASVGIVAGTYVALYGYTWFAWYDSGANSPTLQFRDERYFGRDTYAGGVDKLGHTWSNYTLVRATSQLLRWGGISRTASLMSSVALANAFFTLIEVKDGYRPQYGRERRHGYVAFRD